VAVVDLEHPEPGIALIGLNRPERLNAINFELVRALHRALDE
jgi:enoyl-CoA hydratase